MTARLFRDHYWKPALRAAGIDADPHQCRHWFVTNALRQLEEGEPTEAELARRKQELIQYMGWHSGERTLKAYEHVHRTDSFARRLSSIHEVMRQRERKAAAATGALQTALADRAPPPPTASSRSFWEKIMTIEESIAAIRQCTATEWTKSKPVPSELVIALCDALWEDGRYPQIKLIREYFSNLHVRALVKGFHESRRVRGLHIHYPRWANPHIGSSEALMKILSPAVAQAPLTCLDPANDGRWQTVHPRSVAYLASIPNQSVRDVLALYGLIKASLGDRPALLPAGRVRSPAAEDHARAAGRQHPRSRFGGYD